MKHLSFLFPYTLVQLFDQLKNRGAWVLIAEGFALLFTEKTPAKLF
jgi:hypothetical protein